MPKLDPSIVVIAAGLLLSFNALASPRPAVGEHPLFDGPAVTAATLQPAAGSADAARQRPAAGEQPWSDDPVLTASTVQRSVVRADATRHMPAAGEMSARAATPAVTYQARDSGSSGAAQIRS